MQWDLVWDGLVRIIREGMGLVFCLVWGWWYVNRVPGNKGRFMPLKVQLSRVDWRGFLGDAAFILIAGYADQIVSDLAGILTSRLSASEAAGNHVVSRVTLYPSLGIRGLQAAINTLGSKYLGEQNDRAFVTMAFTCIAVAVAAGLLCTVMILSFADRIFAFYTQEKEVLADLAPTPLAMAVQVSSSLVTTVVAGVVVASQEFRLQSIVYASGLLLVFMPIVLFVANDPKIEMSIARLLWANAAYQCWLCAWQVYIATVYVPRKLRTQRAGREIQASEYERADESRGLHAALFGGLGPTSSIQEEGTAIKRGLLSTLGSE
jgi:Na+-driven multidrug efflux pump